MDKKEKDASQEVERLRRKVHNLEEQLRYYKKAHESNQEKELENHIRFFRDRYRNIGRIYYVWIMAEKEKSREPDQIILKEISELLEKEVKGGDQKLGSITDNLDQDFGIITLLKSEFPDIGPADYCLFCYLAAGFDMYLIIELLGLSGENLFYSRKRRLKGKLKKLHSPHEGTYLALIK